MIKLPGLTLPSTDSQSQRHFDPSLGFAAEIALYAQSIERRSTDMMIVSARRPYRQVNQPAKSAVSLAGCPEKPSAGRARQVFHY
jgi:hypothetical protein